MKALDMLGNEIVPGDIIAYALTVGRSANMAVYRVEEVVIVDAYGYGQIKKVAKLKATKLRESYGLQTNHRVTTLAMCDERALVINESAKKWPSGWEK